MIERRNKFNSRFAVGFAGVLIVFISAAALTSEVFAPASRLTSWIDGWSRMALPTIVCFLFTGSAFVVISLTNRFWNK